MYPAYKNRGYNSVRRSISNIRLLISVLLLFLLGFTSGCTRVIPPEDIDIPYLVIDKYSVVPALLNSPVTNLTLADVSSLPVLRSAIEEVLASDLTDNQWEFQITQTEWDQILQLFQELQVPPEDEGSNTWYTFIELLTI